MNELTRYMTLPDAVSDRERRYLRKVNAMATWFLAVNVPIFVAVAAFQRTGPWVALALSSALLVGPVLAGRVLDNPRAVSRVVAVAGVGMGGLLVHFGQGPMQIEMHFYFFVFIALLTVFANPSVILVAAGTTAAHHLIIYAFFPSSVFNYHASVWVVAVHAGFVVVESVVCCYVSREFFDNVIGLEQIVERRTRELDARRSDMRLILDNVGQGFLRVLPDGTVSEERSAVADEWLGAPRPGEKVWSYFGRTDGTVSVWLRLGVEALAEDTMPLELSLAQMPTRMASEDRTLALGYRAILDGEKLSSLLVIISDVTAEIAREESEQERADVVAVFERVTKDRAGFMEFLAESHLLVKFVANASTSAVDARRYIHTLKGNSLLVGLGGFARDCHNLETHMSENGDALAPDDRNRFVERWRMASSKVEALLGEGGKRIELSEEDWSALRLAVASGRARGDIVDMIEDFALEPTQRRLERVAEDARTVALRLGKGEVQVTIDAGNLRLARERWSPLWSSVTHLVRNALDHGIESQEEREAGGKPPGGTLSLSTTLDGEEFVIALADDGAGIDWEQIRELAERRGLAHATQADLEAALFSDGLSTKETVTEYSGRGVGMSSVAAATRVLAGRIRVQSRRLKGTRIELRFPRSALRPAPREAKAFPPSGRISITTPSVAGTLQ